MNKIVIVLLISSSISAMEQAEHNKRNQQLALMQQVFKALDVPKTDEECSVMLDTATKRDRIAAAGSQNSEGPFRAAWRDGYSYQISAARSGNPAAVVAKKCPFHDQYQSDDHAKHNILERISHCGKMLNLNPYFLLHYLLIPFDSEDLSNNVLPDGTLKCAADWDKLPQEARYQGVRYAQQLMKFYRNIGFQNGMFFINLDDVCAGKSVDHAHLHGMPCAEGDTSQINSFVAEYFKKSERQRLTHDELAQGKTSLWYALKNEDYEQLRAAYVPYIQLMASMRIPRPHTHYDCHVCQAAHNTHDDVENLVIQRPYNKWVLMLLRNGFIGGHLSLYPIEHGKTFDRLNEQELQEFEHLINISRLTIRRVLKFPGTNIGILEGKKAGNEYPDHARADIVPRDRGQVSATTVFRLQDGAYIGDKDLIKLREAIRDGFEKEFSV